jgi:hypothetical protein
MNEFLVEVVVISFTLGGIVGGLVALSLNTKKKSAAEIAEEKPQDILHP